MTIYIVFYQFYLFFMFDLFVLLPFSAVKKKLLRKNRCLEENVVIMEETMTNAEAKVKELSGDFFFSFLVLPEVINLIFQPISPNY